MKSDDTNPKKKKKQEKSDQGQAYLSYCSTHSTTQLFFVEDHHTTTSLYCSNSKNVIKIKQDLTFLANQDRTKDMEQKVIIDTAVPTTLVGHKLF